MSKPIKASVYQPDEPNPNDPDPRCYAVTGPGTESPSGFSTASWSYRSYRFTMIEAQAVADYLNEGSFGNASQEIRKRYLIAMDSMFEASSLRAGEKKGRKNKKASGSSLFNEEGFGGSL